MDRVGAWRSRPAAVSRRPRSGPWSPWPTCSLYCVGSRDGCISRGKRLAGHGTAFRMEMDRAVYDYYRSSGHDSHQAFCPSPQSQIEMVCLTDGCIKLGGWFLSDHSSFPASANMPCETEQKINDSIDAFFKDFANNVSPLLMLVHFSNTSPVVLQHGPKTCPYPFRWRVAGLNAVRSYFDLIATTWSRSGVKICEPPKIDANSRHAIVELSADWTWRKSGRTWTEDFTWDLEFDEGMKITNFVVRTTSDPATCLMRAVDGESKKYLHLTVSTMFYHFVRWLMFF